MQVSQKRAQPWKDGLTSYLCGEGKTKYVIGQVVIQCFGEKLSEPKWGGAEYATQVTSEQRPQEIGKTKVSGGRSL